MTENKYFMTSCTPPPKSFDWGSHRNLWGGGRIRVLAAQIGGTPSNLVQH